MLRWITAGESHGIALVAVLDGLPAGVEGQLQRAALVGWRETSLVTALRESELDLARARLRFPGKTAVLLRFGVMADQAMLAGAPAEGTPREKLFDLLMLRFDQLQAHRGGVLALMDALRTDPATGLLLYGATLRSMRWMLDAAGVPSSGIVGGLRLHGLAAVWAYALRAWQDDESPDLPSTMAAVDRGLDRAMQAEDMLPGRARVEAAAEEMPDGMGDGMDGPEPPPTITGPVIAAAEGGPGVL